VAAILREAGWRGHLELGFARTGPRTVLARRRHHGPLLVQRPFYPEGEVCHVYLVHPPGGIVGGDELQFDAHAGEGAHALITTPAATKFYRSPGKRAVLRQDLQVQAGAVVEWLPQETIAFDGAHAQLSTRVHLEEDARFIGWEVLCLGRPASRDAWLSGELYQAIELWRDGQPLFVERSRLDGGSRVLDEAWGLAGHTVTATLVATAADQSDLRAVREVLAQSDATRSAATLMDDVLAVRCLAQGAEQARRQLQAVWTVLRPSLLGRAAVAPRIWST